MDAAAASATPAAAANCDGDSTRAPAPAAAAAKAAAAGCTSADPLTPLRVKHPADSLRRRIPPRPPSPDDGDAAFPRNCSLPVGFPPPNDEPRRLVAAGNPRSCHWSREFRGDGRRRAPTTGSTPGRDGGARWGGELPQKAAAPAKALPVTAATLLPPSIPSCIGKGTSASPSTSPAAPTSPDSRSATVSTTPSRTSHDSRRG